jgi:pimeloyl-ACP methyl ester carboxylesterase
MSRAVVEPPVTGGRLHPGGVPLQLHQHAQQSRLGRGLRALPHPAPGSWVWAYGLIANFRPGHHETWVDYSNDARAPQLFISGGDDHIMPGSVNRSNAKHYAKSSALTEVFDFPGRSHWTCAEPGWEAVADKALEWASSHARTSRPEPSATA